MQNRITIEEIQTIEPGILQELSGLLKHVVEDGASVGFLPPLSQDEADDYWQGVLGHGVVLWAAKKDGRTIGTVQLQLALKANGSHRAEIAKLMVHPEHRRHGAARMLMHTAENRAKSLGKSLLVLDTRSGDPSNLLYRSLKYVEAGRIPKFARSSNGQLHETTFYYKEI